MFTDKKVYYVGKLRMHFIEQQTCWGLQQQNPKGHAYCSRHPTGTCGFLCQVGKQLW